LKLSVPDAAYIATFVTLLVGIIAATVSLREGAKNRAAAERRESARQYGEAMAAALEWLELPYRVLRRTSDDAPVVQEIVNHFHDVQQSITFHQQWMTLASTELGACYGELVRAVKSKTAPMIRRAWSRPATERPMQMSISDVIDDADVSAELQALTVAIRRQLNAI
jgi:hypothetical protein